MADQAEKDRFVAALIELGGSAGDGGLGDALKWDEATYKAVKNDLVAKGVVTAGRGCGGSVSLDAEPQAEVGETASVAARAEAKTRRAQWRQWERSQSWLRSTAFPGGRQAAQESGAI